MAQRGEETPRRRARGRRGESPTFTREAARALSSPPGRGLADGAQSQPRLRGLACPRCRRRRLAAHGSWHHQTPRASPQARGKDQHHRSRRTQDEVRSQLHPRLQRPDRYDRRPDHRRRRDHHRRRRLRTARADGLFSRTRARGRRRQRPS